MATSWLWIDFLIQRAVCPSFLLSSVQTLGIPACQDLAELWVSGSKESQPITRCLLHSCLSRKCSQLSELPSHKCNRHYLGCQGCFCSALSCTFKASAWPGHHPGRLPLRGAQGCWGGEAALGAMVGFHADTPNPSWFRLFRLCCPSIVCSPVQLPEECVQCVASVLHSTLRAREAARSIFCSAKQEAALPHFRGFSVRTKMQNTWKCL